MKKNHVFLTNSFIISMQACAIGMAMAHIYVQGSGCLVGFQAVLFGQDKFSTPLTI